MKKLKLFDDDEGNTPKIPRASRPEPIKEAEYEPKGFEQFELNEKVVQALNNMSYQHATKVQAETLPHTLADKDILCLSETGSGKTLSFVLPIVNRLVNWAATKPKSEMAGLALILSPTRELSMQTKDYFDRFLQQRIGGWGTVAIYGGTDAMKQVIELAKGPSVIIGTPGRVLHHLQNTKGFNLNNLKFFVLDEADKLLNMDFQKQINDIIQMIPKDRVAWLYSATLTSRVSKLQRVSLSNPVKVQLNSKYHTVEKLEQHYVFIPAKHKDCYLVYLLHKMRGQKAIVYVKTCMTVVRLSLMLKSLNFKVTCLHGQLTQKGRQGNLERFRNGERNVLVSTDVSSRGIDVSDVELVINYDVPPPKDYIHRVGRTARMGKNGLALTIVTQYDVEDLQKIELCIEEKLSEYQIQQDDALIFQERVELSQREVSKKMRGSNTAVKQEQVQ